MSSPKRVSFNPVKYAGRLEDAVALQNLMRTDLSPERIPILNLFLARYRTYPCTAVIEALPRSAKLHVPTIRRYLETGHQHSPLDDIVHRHYHPRTRSLYITAFLADLGHGIMIDCDRCQLTDEVDNPNKYRSDGPTGSFLITDRIRIHYLPQHENLVVGDLASQLSSFYVFPSQSKMIQVLVKNAQQNYSFFRVTIKKPMIYDLDLNYGSNFLGFHDRLMKTFSHPEWRGIVVLHGHEGTGNRIFFRPRLSEKVSVGKTYYLRYLINELDRLRLICIPVDLLTVDLSDLTPSLKTQSNAILIIDDVSASDGIWFLLMRNVLGRIVEQRKSHLCVEQTVSPVSAFLFGDTILVSTFVDISCAANPSSLHSTARYNRTSLRSKRRNSWKNHSINCLRMTRKFYSKP